MPRRVQYTWAKGNMKSVIDYALLSDKMYNKLNRMIIDEDQELMDLSHHNLIEIQMEAACERKNYNSKDWITRDYYKTDKKSLIAFRNELERSIVREKINNIKELEGSIMRIANKVLKGKYRRKNTGIKHKEEGIGLK